MQIKDILKKTNRKNKSKKRVGRGKGSNKGKTCGRGHKGEKARSGSKLKPGFEGGQMPLYRRIPKRGFNNPISSEYQIVNVKRLGEFRKGKEVTPKVLRERGIIKKKSVPVKILGDGELEKDLKVKAHKFSEGAKKKIENAGGEVIKI